MWRVIATWALAACGGSQTPAPVPEPDPLVPISVEWKVAQGEGHQVDVALVVDGTKHELGSLEAATGYEPGTPNTCALRAASQRATAIVCGDGNGFAADLVDGELVVSFDAGDRREEVKRIPVAGHVLAVKVLALPLDEPVSGP